MAENCRRMVRAWDIPIEELQNFDFKPVQKQIVKKAMEQIDPVVINYLVADQGSSQPTFQRVADLTALMNQLANGARPYATKNAMSKILEAQEALQDYLDVYYPDNPKQYTPLPSRAEIPHLGVNTLCEMRQLLH